MRDQRQCAGQKRAVRCADPCSPSRV
jgi:hypothetical protein